MLIPALVVLVRAWRDDLTNNTIDDSTAACLDPSNDFFTAADTEAIPVASTLVPWGNGSKSVFLVQMRVSGARVVGLQCVDDGERLLVNLDEGVVTRYGRTIKTFPALGGGVVGAQRVGIRFDHCQKTLDLSVQFFLNDKKLAHVNLAKNSIDPVAEWVPCFLSNKAGSTVTSYV